MVFSDLITVGVTVSVAVSLMIALKIVQTQELHQTRLIVKLTKSCARDRISSTKAGSSAKRGTDQPRTFLPCLSPHLRLCFYSRDPALLCCDHPRMTSNVSAKTNQQNFEYVIRSGLAGGVAGCAVSTNYDFIAVRLSESVEAVFLRQKLS